eukprot:4961079-Pyramimonas_sp.AAC.3
MRFSGTPQQASTKADTKPVRSLPARQKSTQGTPAAAAAATVFTPATMPIFSRRTNQTQDAW